MFDEVNVDSPPDMLSRCFPFVDNWYDLFCSELAMRDDYPVLVAELDVEELTGKST